MLDVDRPPVLDDDLVGLYEETFPEEEKIPLENLYRTVGKGGRFMVFSDSGRKVGFCFLYEGREAVFLVYLATFPSMRNKAYGAEILDIVRNEEGGRTVFLVLEPVKGDAGDAMRVRRKGFYLRNGGHDTGGRLLSDEVWFDSIYFGKRIAIGSLQATVFEYERIHRGL
ncbi:MAG: hypothetical protein MJZ68_07940 [archaeon]|nr:hypothetical protein [archaeon]